MYVCPTDPWPRWNSWSGYPTRGSPLEPRQGESLEGGGQFRTDVGGAPKTRHLAVARDWWSAGSYRARPPPSSSFRPRKRLIGNDSSPSLFISADIDRRRSANATGTERISDGTKARTAERRGKNATPFYCADTTISGHGRFFPDAHPPLRTRVLHFPTENRQTRAACTNVT